MLEAFNAACDWIREFINYGNGQIVMYTLIGGYCLELIFFFIESFRDDYDIADEL